MGELFDTVALKVIRENVTRLIGPTRNTTSFAGSLPVTFI